MGSRCLATVAWALILLVWLPLIVMAHQGIQGKVVRLAGGAEAYQSGLQLALADGRLGNALRTSLWVALLSGALATTIVAANLCVLRLAAARRGGGRPIAGSLAKGLSTGALMVPELALGVGLAIALSWSGLARTLPGLVLAHTVLGCLVGLPLGLSLTERISLSTEMAAMDVGCGKLATAWRVTIPSNRSVLLAIFMVSSILSFEDYVLALFVAPSGATTLPVYIFSLIRFRRLEEANALGLLLVLVALAVTVGLHGLVRYGRLAITNPGAKE